MRRERKPKGEHKIYLCFENVCQRTVCFNKINDAGAHGKLKARAFHKIKLTENGNNANQRHNPYKCDMCECVRVRLCAAENSKVSKEICMGSECGKMHMQ